jgi:hypothetical protein
MKLYVYERTVKAYVLAETKEEAMDCSPDIARYENPDESCYETSSNELGWDLDCFVYHNGTDDITVRKALEIVKNQSQN